jgi:predicted PurR-regulated permease PerM
MPPDSTSPADRSPMPPADVPSAVAPPAPPDRVHLAALAFLTLCLIALCVYVTVPFLPALTWGIALAIIALPMHRWLSARLGRESLAAFLSMLTVVALILVPMAYVSYQIARETAVATEKVREGMAEVDAKEKLSEVPGVGRVVDWLDRVHIDVEAQARKMVAGSTRDVSGLAAGSLAAVFQFLVTAFVLFYALRDRALLMRAVRGLLPLSRGECAEVFDRASASVHANLYATVVVGVVNGVTGGLVFWAVGLPAPLLWGVVMTVLSILPMIGTGFVWVPAAAFLVFKHEYVHAAAVVAYGLLTFIIVGNVLYYRLAGDRMHMHEIPAMISFLGGLAVFGVSGMVLGPAIYAVSGAFLEVWKGRMGTDPEPERIPPPDKDVTGPM